MASSWPWMKGIDLAIADPIPPVSSHDTRPSVKDLIKENRKVIDKVKEGLKDDPLYDATRHDDLWIVRFVLSHKKKGKAALKAAKSTLLFREEFKFNEVDLRFYTLGGAGNHNNPWSQGSDQYLSFCPDDGFLYTVPAEQRGVIEFLNFANIDEKGIVDAISEEKWTSALAYPSEWSFQWLDYMTRTTGRLTKTLRIIDMKTANITGMNMEKMKRDGKAMGVMEDCYPQSLHGIFICNVSAVIQVPWRVLRPLMPKRVASKIDFIDPLANKKERNRLLAYVSEENLPARFGGKNEVWPVKMTTPPKKE